MPLSNLGVDFPSVVQNPSKEELFTRHLQSFRQAHRPAEVIEVDLKEISEASENMVFNAYTFAYNQYDQLLCCLGCVAVAPGAGKRASALLF